VRLTLAADKLNSDSWDLLSAHTKKVQQSQENGNYVVEIDEGGHFGEWALIGESITFTAISVGDVICSTITKEKFDLIVGSLPKLPQADSKYCTCSIFFIVSLSAIGELILSRYLCRLKDSLIPKEHSTDEDFSFRRVQLSDLVGG
jgi:hypothetical protein